MREQDVLEVARAIRPHLGELLGEEAADVEEQLARLLADAEEGRSVRFELLRLLTARDATRLWARRLLDVPPALRSYQSVPGRVQRVSVPSYRCPEGDGETWYRFSVGDPIPVCPEHGVPLARTS